MHTVTPDATNARRFRLGLAAFVGFAGAMHFLNPRFFDEIVPTWMPGSARAVTYVSGAAELTCAALVANRRTARVGGWATLLLFAGVYPANVQMTIDVGRPTSFEDWAIWVRTPLQIPMFLWARKVARDATYGGIIARTPVPGTSSQPS